MYYLAMPTRKSSRSRSTSASTTTARRVSTAEELSYETKLVIVVLLLLFVYPLGLVFMWFWMKNWPTWLKEIISLPVIFGIIGICMAIFFVSLVIRHAVTNGNFQNEFKHHYEQQYMNDYPMQRVSPTELPSPTETPSAAY